MSSSLIRGKYIISRVIDNNRAEVIEEGAIFQRDGKIVEIGAEEDLSGRHQPDEVLGDGSHVVVPGFVNAHHHIGVTPVQLGCPDLPLELWIPWRLAARSVDPYIDTLYSAFEMIESGVTTVQHINSLFFGPVEPCAQAAEEVLRAYRDIGMRVSYSFMIHDQNHIVYEADDEFVSRLPGELRHRMTEFLGALELPAADQFQLFEDLYARHNGEPLILTNSLASNDVGIVHAGYQKYRKKMLRGGVELYELNKKLTRKERKEKKGKTGSSKASLHAKSFVFDRRQVFIGSLNLDPRALEHNTEIGVVLEVPEIAEEMAVRFDKNIEEIAFRLELKKEHDGYERLYWHGWEDGKQVVFIITWIVNLFLSRKDTAMRGQIKRFVAWPLRFLLWLLLEQVGLSFIGLSMTVRTIFRFDPVFPFVLTWTAVRLVDLIVFWWGERLRRSGREDAIVLLRPARTAIRITIIIAAVLFWLDNIGLKVSTLLAGLGVGGLAVALAAQDTLKNLLGSVMILLDKPYRVGQRIVAKGHDGIVEEIGLRSTRIRLLTGHLTTIPNDEMAKIDIENIGQRPHIRRKTNIGITYDTPPEKIEKAVDIILQILDNHEGMDPEFPPRACFNEYDPYSLNILVIYWYHPADYWDYMKFSQGVNLQIAREFQKEGIKFAFPTSTTFLSQEDNQPLFVNLDRSLFLDQEKAQTE